MLRTCGDDDVRAVCVRCRYFILATYLHIME